MIIEANDFVGRGLLPENLPLAFTGQDIARGMPNSVPLNSTLVGDITPYNSIKRGGQRRVFGVPHPVFVQQAAAFFSEHWRHIDSVLLKSSGSVSRPVFRSFSRPVHLTPHSELAGIRLRKLSPFRFCLVTDVSRFYPSVYTHALGWALHGKRACKSERSPESKQVFGNYLDFMTRQAQLGQTIGLPIGPDSSKISAEILMSAVDADFSARSKNPSFVRHVDDYWIGGRTASECEVHLHNLRASLQHFGLDINENKTHVIETNRSLADPWPISINQTLKQIDQGITEKELILSLVRIINLATDIRDDSVIRHAVRHIDEVGIWNEHWSILEPFLVSAVVQFPHSIEYVAQIVVWMFKHHSIDENLWTIVFLQIVLDASSTGRDSETCWSLWFLHQTNKKLPTRYSNSIIANCGPLVLAYLVHFGKHNLCSDNSLYSKLRNRVEGDPYSGSCWPLTLELKHVSADNGIPWRLSKVNEGLMGLHDQKVSIINWNNQKQNQDHDALRSGNAIDVSSFGYGEVANYFDENDDLPF
ncbi:MAG: RNA-directed DNA polymerase [Burkholderiales bacterium]|nr:RNA-directed DNA polymerase [Burkholderiales bacterium]